jgi:hypothetical protein
MYQFLDEQGRRAVCALPGCPDKWPWMEGHKTDLIYGDPQ